MSYIKNRKKTYRKRTKQNEDKQPTTCRVQNTGYKDTQELTEDLNSIKKTQSEMKDTLFEIKKNLQGSNGRVDEADNEINDVEHKEAKNNQSEKQEEKKNLKRTRIV